MARTGILTGLQEGFMNEQIHYASQILAQLIETPGTALPGIFASLAVIVAFVMAVDIGMPA